MLSSTFRPWCQTPPASMGDVNVQETSGTTVTRNAGQVSIYT